MGKLSKKKKSKEKAAAKKASVQKSVSEGATQKLKTENESPADNQVYSEQGQQDDSSRKKNSLQRYWAPIVAISVIVTIITGVPTIRNWFKSTHTQFEEQKTDSGTLKAPEIKPVQLSYDTLETIPIITKARTDTFPVVKGIKLKNVQSESIVILVGHTIWQLSKSIIEKGIRIFDPKTNDECSQTSLKIILKNERIYISAEFRDLKNEFMLGFMDYNHWKVYLDNLLDYRFDDYKLEVLDKQGYVIFSIKLSNEDADDYVSLSGYFINPNSVLIVSSELKPKGLLPGEKYQTFIHCISKKDSGWHLAAEQEIHNIKSVFDKD